ncbi:MAG: AAA family ATPase [Mycoplasmatota bacterium]
MVIEKIKLENFKKFSEINEINFNDKINIIIGNNESGKSTILEAINYTLCGSQSMIEKIGVESLFNNNVIIDYMKTEREYSKLPVLKVEIFLKETGNSNLEGNNNTEKTVCQGLSMNIVPNDEYSEQIIKELKDENSVFPYYYYKIYFEKFSGDKFNQYNKPLKHIFIDNIDNKKESSNKNYVQTLFNSYANKLLISKLNTEYRKSKNDYEKCSLKDFNEKVNEIDFGLDNNSKYSLENNLAIYKDGINLQNYGLGMQSIVKIKNSINKKVNNIDFILLEEPENHLSDINLRKLIDDIANEHQKQLFLTTHNSNVCSRLNLKNIIAVGKTANKDFKLSSLTDETAEFFMKNTTNNILNFILSDKVILVEGAAEYILLEKFYKLKVEVNPDKDCVNIISANNLSFLRYLEIAKILNKKVCVITDNDGNYKNNITHKYKEYNSDDNIKIFSEIDENKNTFEVCLYELNSIFLFDNKLTKSTNILNFMLENKSESAFRLSKILEKENNKKFIIPDYICEAIKWIRK